MMSVKNCDQNTSTLYHILVLGQSLSMGYATLEVLPPIDVKDAYMFHRVRTQDFGYLFGITKEEYRAEPSKWEDKFYRTLLPLREAGGDGDTARLWESASPAEFETPCSGIVQGLDDAYRAAGKTGKPYPVLISAPGIGGTPITDYAPGTRIFSRAKADVENGMRLAAQRGLSYAVLGMVWLQGENNYDMPMEEYAAELLARKREYADMIRAVTGQEGEIPFVTYQTMAQKTYYPLASQNPALAQFSLAAGERGVALSAPCYQFAMYIDHVHLTNTATRDMGILLGHALYGALHGESGLFRPSTVTVQGKTAVLTFAFPVALDAVGAVSSHDAARISANAGFFGYTVEGSPLNFSAVLSEDGKTLVLQADGEIAQLVYGYDPRAEENTGYTYGGAVRKAVGVPGTSGVLMEYMPVQPLY